ncbi:sensor histidine kinase [Hymenobacter defluvii]|uniref:histidine kinase n=1 Tax=Hymenobacter defluvii TaxID=2054411 RepID=A0ABS3TBC4_9BACT|nr:HAMP domain-containing sensor histidine kinase [Hymenobacter defluvii]MBO3270955.1 HAMP domain-containing histidine kinase [Hymenobacter defluvii]
MLIRNKLLLRFTLLVVGIQLALSAFIYYFSSFSREQRYYHRLEGKAVLAARLLIRRANLDTAVLRTFRRADLLTMHQEYIGIYDEQNQLVYGLGKSLRPLPDSVYLNQIRSTRPAHFQLDGREGVGILYQHQGRSYRVLLVGQDVFGAREFAKLRLLLLVGNLGALVLIILAGWYFTDQALRPIARVVRQVKRITASNLSRRVAEGNRRDEIAQLAITFNEMLSGLEQAFESQKSFLSHASHELRTPLANLLGTLETSLAYDHDLSEARQSTASAMEEIRRLIALTNDLLALAKADDTAFRREPVRLDECVTQALTLCKTKYPTRTIRLDFDDLPEEVEDPFMVLGNAQLLTTVVFNLLDNACKYSAGAVSSTLGYADSATLRLTITDAGKGMSSAELTHVFEPLYRGESGRHMPGHGLGLPITRKIVQRHGGQLTLASEPGAGTTATVLLAAVQDVG